LTVTNSAPIFENKLKNIKMLLNEELEVFLPEPKDHERNQVDISVVIPEFM